MNIVVTGGSRGLGLAIAKAFVDNGDNVLMGARSKDIKSIASSVGATGHGLDISSEESVRLFCEKSKAVFNGTVDVLINNAGIYGPMDKIGAVDLKEWTDTIQTNLIGTVYMCHYMLPLLRQSKRANIINISGGGATAPMPNISAYAASKAAVVRFSETLAGELRPEKICVNTIAPGALNTSMLDEVLKAGAGKVGAEFYNKSLAQKENGGTPLNKATDLCLHLASQSDITGKLISAVWDDWKNFESSINDTDIYTLRRIVPKDRGIS